MGIYDTPAMIKYVTEYTGFSKIHYVGFSMGNSAMFKYIDLMLFGQALQNVFSAIPVLHPVAAGILHRILPVICNPKIDLIGVCSTIQSIMFGDDKGQITRVRYLIKI